MTWRVCHYRSSKGLSLCTLLNARSARAKGVQLMISLMLVARATNKQVHNALVAQIDFTHETITTPNLM